MLDADGLETSPLIHVRARPHGSLSWAAARDIARATGAEGGSPMAEVPLSAALGAVLGADLVSAIDVPALDTAAMDGYAVAGEGPWTVLGRSLAGRGAPVARLRRGEAVEIATGAVVPEGTLAVLPYEEAETEAGAEFAAGPEAAGAVVYGACAPGRHIRRRGETIAAGALAARRGAAVTPALLGLAAGLGLDTLPVTRPVVRVLVTGDEIVHSGRPRPGAVRDAIGPVLPGLVAWAGGRCEAPRALPDGRAALVTALADLPGDHVAAVGGSSSAGPADHLRAALAGLGARIAVDGVACRPGHPQLLAVLPSGAVVVGLPGNPGAALAAALTLLVPVLCGRTGRRDPAHGGRRARLSATTGSHPADTRLLPVRVHGDHAVEIESRGSADLRGAAAADALAVVPPAAEGVAVDGTVELMAVPT